MGTSIKLNLGSSLEAIASQVALDPFDRSLEGLVDELQAFLDDDEAAAVAWLQDLSDVLIEREQYQPALDFLDYFNTRKSIPFVERKIANHWMSKDFDDILVHLEKRSLHESMVNPHQIAIFDSLTQNEHPEHQTRWMSWIRDLQQNPEHDVLYGSAVTHLLGNMNSETRDQVIKFVETNASESRISAEIVARALDLVPSVDENGLAWISSLKIKDEEMRAAAFAEVFYAMTSKDNLLTADILSSAHFLDTYYQPGKQSIYTKEGNPIQEAKNFYDTVLSSYLITVANEDPQIILDSVDAFFNKELKEEYTKIAQDIFNSPFFVQAKACPGCDNPDHKH